MKHRVPIQLMQIALVTLVALVLAVPSANAATLRLKTVTFASEPLPVPVAEPPADGYVGGNYYYCAANPRWGEMCVDIVVKADRNGNPMPPACGWVKFEAKCGCNQSTLATKGMCTYHYPR